MTFVVEVSLLTFLLALWLYQRLPKPERLWQIGVALAVAFAWPLDHGQWVALTGLVVMWLAALWLVGWAATVMSHGGVR